MNNNIIQQALKPDEILELSKLDQIGPGKALLKLAAFERDRRRKTNEEKPAISDDIARDWRTISGRVAALNEVLDSPARAKKINAEVNKGKGPHS